MKAFVITNKSKNLNGIISNLDENHISILWENKKEEKLTNEALSSLLDSDNYNVEEVDVDLNEDEEDTSASTPAQKSIKMHTTTDNDEKDGNPKTKLDWIRNIVGSLADMDTESLANLQNQILGQVGGEADRAGVSQDTDKNRASIQMKPSAAVGKSPMYTETVKLQKEEMDTIFGESELTEDAKNKISTLFETSVAIRLSEEVLKIQESYDKKTSRKY
jgi:acylphosphatase